MGMTYTWGWSMCHSDHIFKEIQNLATKIWNSLCSVCYGYFYLSATLEEMWPSPNRGTVQFRLVRQSRVTRPSDVPKWWALSHVTTRPDERSVCHKTAIWAETLIFFIKTTYFCCLWAPLPQMSLETLPNGPQNQLKLTKFWPCHGPQVKVMKWKFHQACHSHRWVMN
jgi:hypothetical protein